MIRVLHCADLHLDTPVSTTGGGELLRGVLLALDNRIAEAQIQLVLMAGDIFDGTTVTRNTVHLLRHLFENHSQTRFFIAAGNHDPYTEDSVYATQSWPSNVNIFTKDVLERVYVEELDCDVYGASFTGNVARSDLLEGFTPVNSERLNFMVLHGEVGGGEYRSITEKQLSLCGMDYVALGHIHAQSGIRLAGKTAYAWPGCPQGRGFDECGEKGVYEGTVGKGKAEMHFMPLASKRYEIVRIPADGVTSNAELAARCRQLAQPDADVFMRFQLVGHVPMGLEINSSFLKEECEGFAELEIVDDTALEVEWESLKEERSLRGAFVQRLLPLLQSEDERTRRVAQMALRAGLSALEGEKVTL